MILITPEQSVRKLDLGALTVRSAGPNEQALHHNLGLAEECAELPLERIHLDHLGNRASHPKQGMHIPRQSVLGCSTLAIPFDLIDQLI